MYVPYQRQSRRNQSLPVYHRGLHGRTNLKSAVQELREDPCATNDFLVNNTTPCHLQRIHQNNVASSVSSSGSSYPDCAKNDESCSDSSMNEDEIRLHVGTSVHNPIDTPKGSTRVLKMPERAESEPLEVHKPYDLNLMADISFITTRVCIGRSGITENHEYFDIFYESSARSEAWSKIVFSMQKNELRINLIHFFSVSWYRIFSFNVLFADIAGPLAVETRGQSEVLCIRTRVPPRTRCKAQKHGSYAASLKEAFCQSKLKDEWSRCSEIFETGIPASRTTGPLRLFHERALFEIGRCNTIEVVFRPGMKSRGQLISLLSRLEEQNLKWFRREKEPVRTNITKSTYRAYWNSIYANSSRLSFDVRYLFEAAISRGSIDERHIAQIGALLQSANCDAAKNVLTQLAYGNAGLEDPSLYLEKLLSRQSAYSSLPEIIPSYCCKIRKAVVTVSSSKKNGYFLESC